MGINVITAITTNISDYPTGQDNAAALRAKAVKDGWLPAAQGELIHQDEITSNESASDVANEMSDAK